MEDCFISGSEISLMSISDFTALLGCGYKLMDKQQLLNQDKGTKTIFYAGKQNNILERAKTEASINQDIDLIGSNNIIPIEKTFLIIGNYKQICCLFANFYNTKCGFNNTLQEIAVFIDKYFYFTEGEKNPTVQTIFDFLKAFTKTESKGTDFPKKENVKLKWSGDQNLLYYIFLKIFIPRQKNKNTYDSLCLMKGRKKDLAIVIFDEIKFDDSEQTIETLAESLSRPFKKLVKVDIPYINWNLIKTIK